MFCFFTLISSLLHYMTCVISVLILIKFGVEAVSLELMNMIFIKRLSAKHFTGT